MAIYKIEKDASGVPTGETSLVAGGTNFADAPIGTIFATMSASAPSGFLMCDGTAYSATDYPELWAILPSTVKDTTNNTFTIDLRESTLKGVGLTSKSSNHYDSDGIALGEFIDDRIKNHNHDMKNSSKAIRSGSRTIGTDESSLAYGDGSVYSYLSIDFSGSATNEVKSVGVNYIIKAKMIGVPADFLAKVDEAVSEAMSPTSGILELNTDWLGSCDYSKSGNTVTLTFRQVRPNSTSTSATIVTLPSNLRPKVSCYCVMWINDSDNVQILNVMNTGIITVGGTAGIRTGDAFGSVTFVTD